MPIRVFYPIRFKFILVWRRFFQAIVVFIGVGVLDRVLSAVLEIYALYPFSRERPIKPLVQILKRGVARAGRQRGQGNIETRRSVRRRVPLQTTTGPA